MSQRSPFRYVMTSPEVIRLAVMLYIRFPLTLRNVEDLLHERGHFQKNMVGSQAGPRLVCIICRFIEPTP